MTVKPTNESVHYDSFDWSRACKVASKSFYIDRMLSGLLQVTHKKKTLRLTMFVGKTYFCLLELSRSGSG